MIEMAEFKLRVVTGCEAAGTAEGAAGGGRGCLCCCCGLCWAPVRPTVPPAGVTVMPRVARILATAFASLLFFPPVVTGWLALAAP